MTACLALTDESFDVAVAAKRPTLVAFVAEWCSPSRQLRRELDEFAASSVGFVTIATVDVDAAQSVAVRAAPIGLPMLQLYASGEIIGEHLGAPRRKALRAWIAARLDENRH